MEYSVSDKKKFIWNMIGSTSNALSSFVLLLIVTRTTGSTDGGIFSLAFSTAQLLATVGCFEERAIQATDVTHQKTFSEYFIFRVLTCTLMMLMAIAYVILGNKTGDKGLVILLICFYKALDSLSDGFQGLFQLYDRIDLAGMALGLRVIISTIGFGGVLWFTKNLVIASLSMVFLSIAFLLVFDYRISRKFEVISSHYSIRNLCNLFVECFPLFLGAFMGNYIINASKYAIDTYWSDEIQTYYGFLLMPAFVVNLFSLFVFRPLHTRLAIFWLQGKIKDVISIIKKCLLWILILTVGALLGAWFLGIPILNLVSGLNLTGYKNEFMLIMASGSLNALVALFYYLLTVLRKQWQVLFGYGCGFLAALVLAPILVKKFIVQGAAMAYIIPTAVVALIFAIFVIYYIAKKNREIKGNVHE